jgi:cytochrome b subunit of formate dehydrogenase
MKNIIKIRAILSSLLLITFFIVFLTGMALCFSPSGKIAKTTNWSVFDFDKWQLESIHTFFGIIMSVLVIIHLIINYRLFLNEIKALFKNNI